MTTVTMPPFDKNKLTQELSSLPHHHRIAFAASCCERLLPDYQAFVLVEHWGDWKCLRQALDRIWQLLQEGDLPEQEVRGLIQACESVLPDTEDFPSVFGGLALNAAAGVIYTLQSFLDGSPELVATVGESVTDSLDLYLSVVNDPETGVHAGDPAFYEWVQQAPLMTAELVQQQDDLQALRQHPTLDAEFLVCLRSKSATRGIQPIQRGLVEAADA